MTKEEFTKMQNAVNTAAMYLSNIITYNDLAERVKEHPFKVINEDLKCSLDDDFIKHIAEEIYNSLKRKAEHWQNKFDEL